VDISAVGVGVLAVLRGKTCKEARIALGAVAPTPMRAKKAEGLLLGKALSHEAVEEAAAQAARESKPITDVRASAAYRRAMVAVLTRRALREAKKRATRR
jgi:carbon-monoxide dehydrogenase medium subunit